MVKTERGKHTFATAFHDQTNMEKAFHSVFQHFEPLNDND